MTYAHDDRHRGRTELHDCGDRACVSVHDLASSDVLACYVTLEQARAMAKWLTAWADSRDAEEDER